LSLAMPQGTLTTLAHHMDLDLLLEAYHQTRKDGAVGVDGQSGREYAETLEELPLVAASGYPANISVTRRRSVLLHPSSRPPGINRSRERDDERRYTLTAGHSISPIVCAERPSHRQAGQSAAVSRRLPEDLGPRLHRHRLRRPTPNDPKAIRPARTPHDLRRSGVKHYIDAGVDPHTVMQWSGHRTESMLRRYHIIDLEDLRRAGKRASEYRGPADNVRTLRDGAPPPIEGTTTEPLHTTENRAVLPGCS
jgi:hypothetical protein